MSAAQDGRARAIEAAREGIKRRSWESWGTGDLPSPEDFAEAAVDAALADGGVHAADDCVERSRLDRALSDAERYLTRAERDQAERDAMRAALRREVGPARYRQHLRDIHIRVLGREPQERTS